MVPVGSPVRSQSPKVRGRRTPQDGTTVLPLRMTKATDQRGQAVPWGRLVEGAFRKAQPPGNRQVCRKDRTGSTRKGKGSQKARAVRSPFRPAVEAELTVIGVCPLAGPKGTATAGVNRSPSDTRRRLAGQSVTRSSRSLSTRSCCSGREGWRGAWRIRFRSASTCWRRLR